MVRVREEEEARRCVTSSPPSKQAELTADFALCRGRQDTTLRREPSSACAQLPERVIRRERGECAGAGRCANPDSAGTFARLPVSRSGVDDPACPRQYIQEIVNIDKDHLAKLEQAQIDVPEEINLAKPRSRKSLGGAGATFPSRYSCDNPLILVFFTGRAVDAPSAVQAQENFEEGKQALDKLLEVRTAFA